VQVAGDTRACCEQVVRLLSVCHTISASGGARIQLDSRVAMVIGVGGWVSAATESLAIPFVHSGDSSVERRPCATRQVYKHVDWRRRRVHRWRLAVAGDRVMGASAGDGRTSYACVHVQQVDDVFHS
jgi:hypothetical protein